MRSENSSNQSRVRFNSPFFSRMDNNSAESQQWDIAEDKTSQPPRVAESDRLKNIHTIYALDNDRVALAYNGLSIYIYNIKTNDLEQSLDGVFSGRVRKLEKLGNDRLVSTFHRQCALWDLKTGRVLRTLSLDSKFGYNVFHDVKVLSNRYIVGVNEDKYLVIWSAADGGYIGQIYDKESAYQKRYCLAALDNKIICNGGRPGAYMLKIWNPATQQLEKQIEVATSVEVTALVKINSNTVACGTEQGNIMVVDIDRGVVKQSFKHSGCVLSLQLLSDDCLVSSAKDGTVKFWKIGPFSLTCTKTLKVSEKGNEHMPLAVTPDKQLVIGYGEGQLRCIKFQSFAATEQNQPAETMVKHESSPSL